MLRDSTLMAPKEALTRASWLWSPGSQDQGRQGGESKLDLTLSAALYQPLIRSLRPSPLGPPGLEGGPGLAWGSHHLSCCPAHSPDTGSEVPVANVGVVTTGQECGRGLVHDIQHPRPWGKVTAQVRHQLSTGKRGRAEDESLSHPGPHTFF